MKQHQFVSQLALIMKQSQSPVEKHDLDKDKAHFLDKTHRGVIGALQVLSPEKLLQNPKVPVIQKSHVHSKCMIEA